MARRRLHPNGRANPLSEAWEAEVADTRHFLRSRPQSETAESRGTHAARAPQDKRLSVIKISAYKLGLNLRRFPNFQTVDRLLDRYLETNIRVSLKDNIFYGTLTALNFEANAHLTPQSVSKCAQQLLYAARHDVDPAFLIGFLYQIGTEMSIAEKLRIDFREPWLDEYRKRNNLRRHSS